MERRALTKRFTHLLMGGNRELIDVYNLFVVAEKVNQVGVRKYAQIDI